MSSSSKKLGALSNEEKDFIEVNAGKISLEQIAKELDRHPHPVKRYMRKNRLGEYGDPTKVRTREDIRGDLVEKPFFKILKEQLDAKEMDLFIEQWVGFVSQFGGDILESEQLELRELLFYETLKNRTLTEEKQEIDLAKELRKEEIDLSRIPGDQLKKSDRDQLARIRSRIAVCNDNCKNYRRTFKELSDKADKVRKSLYSSRTKRTEDLDKSKIDFTALLKMYQDWEFKKRAATQMEVMGRAGDRATEKLTGLYEFADGTVEPPIINKDSV